MLLLGRAEWRVLCNILNLFVYFLQNKHRLTPKTDQVTILRTLCLGHTLCKSGGSEVSPMRWDHEVAESRLQANLFNFQNNTLCCLRAWPLLITWKSYLFICLFDSITEREIFCALVCFVNGHTARARQEWGVHSGPSMWVAGVQLLEPSPTASQSVCGTRIKSKARTEAQNSDIECGCPEECCKHLPLVCYRALGETTWMSSFFLPCLLSISCVYVCMWILFHDPSMSRQSAIYKIHVRLMISMISSVFWSGGYVHLLLWRHFILECSVV